MKFVFEKDIPQFEGKAARERMALYRQASQIDRRIVWRQVLLMLSVWGLLVVMMIVHQQGLIPSLPVAAVLYFGLAIPLWIYGRAAWVGPLIQAALREEKK